MENEKNRRSADPASQARRARKIKKRIRNTVFTTFRIIAGIVVFFVTMAVIGCCTAVMGLGIFKDYVDTSLAPTLQVNADDYTMKLSSIFYYQDQESGEWLEFQKIYGTENRIWADYDQMPDALWQAAVAIEDERFFTHKGVDWKRTAGAVVNLFTDDQDTFGGSTITQQLLKNMTGDNKGTVNRKVREIFRALEFEKNYTKQEILELYLNNITLGKGCYGVQTAAEYYFGKDVSELSTAECASLIAITNNPSLYGPMSTVVVTNPETGVKKTARELNKQRQENILWKMKELGYIKTEAEYQAALNEKLHFTDGTTSAEDLVAAASAAKGDNRVNSWFIEQAFKEVYRDLAVALDISEDAAITMLYNGGYQVYTTLDPKIQAIAESVYKDRSNLDVTSAKGQQLQSGITIVDPSTGNIVAMVGAIGEKEGNLVWNFAEGKRQVGSSIKPLTVYAPAIETGAVTPATTFDNYPVRLLNDNPWPKNSPNKYTGMTDIEVGVRNSINTIAVQTLEAVGVTESFAFATEKLGLSLEPDDMNLSGLGMGGMTYGLNTIEMAAAYAAFANGGIYTEPRMYLEVRDANGNVVLKNDAQSQVAMKDTTAYMMNKMLQSVVTAGTGTSARFNGMPIAGKTGTTSENYDRYFVGYTPYYSAAVWTGYEYNEKITYSGNPAITMWKLVMEKIHEELENKPFPEPEGDQMETVEVCADSGLLPTDACRADVRGTARVRKVQMVKGTAPTEECTMHTFVNYCVDGKCLPGSNCPYSSVTQVGVLNIVREQYVRLDEGAAEGVKITAEDDPYVLINMQKAVGLIPEVLEDGTEVYPAQMGCPVHSGWPTTSGGVTIYGTPDLDPSDPNYVPPYYVDELGNIVYIEEGMELPGYDPYGPSWEIPVMPETTVPEIPETPTVDPTDPAAPSGGEDDWWNQLWQE